MSVKIEISKEEIADFCRRNRIRKLAFFGSVQGRAILEHPATVRPGQKFDGVYDPYLEASLPDALLDLK